MAIKVDFSGTNIEAVRKSPEAWAISSGASDSGDTYVKSQTPPRFAANDELNFLRFLPLLGLFAIGDYELKLELTTRDRITHLQDLMSQPAASAKKIYLRLFLVVEKIVYACEMLRNARVESSYSPNNPPAWQKNAAKHLKEAYELAIKSDHADWVLLSRQERDTAKKVEAWLTAQMSIFLSNVYPERRDGYRLAVCDINIYRQMLASETSVNNNVEIDRLTRHYSSSRYPTLDLSLGIMEPVECMGLEAPYEVPLPTLTLKPATFSLSGVKFRDTPLSVLDIEPKDWVAAQEEVRELQRVLETARFRIIGKLERK